MRNLLSSISLEAIQILNEPIALRKDENHFLVANKTMKFIFKHAQIQFDGVGSESERTS